MIDKSTAFTIAGYDYRLCDKEGKQYRIDSAHGYFFKVQDDWIVKNIYFGDIGTIYFILAHPMENLTKEINGVVHLVELANISFPESGFTLQQSVRQKLASNGVIDFWCFNKSFFSMRYEDNYYVLNQLELFNYLNKNHFSHLLPEGSWKQIE